MKTRKVVTALLMLAIAGTSASAIALSACNKPSTTPTSGRTIYVSNTGEIDGAGTKEDPKDIVSTLRSTDLAPGDTIMVMPGEYDISERTMVIQSGEYNKYITIKNADPTKKAVLRFYNMKFDSTNRGVQIYGNYIHWDGIDICGAGDNGMYVGGSYNIIENCEFYDNRDTGLQLGRSYSPSGDLYLEYDDINYWPSYNLIKNCTSYNNYDNETYGENADGFAAKLTVGYGNIFDGCIAYRNSDDGWDLYAKTDSGNIGEVIIYNCVAFDNGFILETQAEFNAKFPGFDVTKVEGDTSVYTTRDGDGNGFKLGGSIMEGEVYVENCLAFNNRMHGVTDNSNPGVIIVDGITAYNNGAAVGKDGKIVYTGNGVDEGSANIDLARQSYSYNHIANTLSVNNGNMKISNDAYRGTVENSVFQYLDSASQTTYSYTVEGQAEYNTKTGDRGVRGTPADASEIFYELPTNDLGLRTDFHKAFRNEDMSINVGNLLKQKDASSTMGCNLSKSSWEDYAHYGLHDLTKMSSKDEADAQAIIDMAYLPVRLEACFQDFDLVTKILNTELTWKSSNPSILNITGNKGTSNSHHEDVRVQVIRPLDADTKVTLTATVTVGSVTKEKSFEVNVKKNTYRVGSFVIDGLDGDALIIDKEDEHWYDYQPPTPVVINGTSDAGYAIDPKLYTLDMYYKFATVVVPNFDNTSDYENRDKFDSTEPGIWQITQTVTFKDNVTLAKSEDGSAIADKTVTYSYLIYVAARDAQVGYMNGESSLAVNKNGYTITGNFTSPTGTIYAVSLPATADAPTAAEIKANEKVETYEFRAIGTTFQFTQENSASYKVYYFLENLDGTAQSQVYEKSVDAVSITTKADFEAMLANNDAAHFYLLQNDIDMGGSVSTSDLAFTGVFNGMGHTISNISIVQTGSKAAFGLFNKVKGGTIMNVNFENITIKDNGANEKTGLIGEMEGGYIYNVKLHNISVNEGFTAEVDGETVNKRVSQRVGALIGQVFATSGTGVTTYIERVSVINDKDESGDYLYSIRGDQRVGAIVGYVQAGGADGWNICYITDCYVDALIESNTYGGGIVGRSDDRNAKDVLEITKCYFIGVNYTQKYAAGILGGFSGTGVLRIYSCVSGGKLYYSEDKFEVLSAEKNCSHIVGYYASNGDARVVNCYGGFSEHNANYDVTVFGEQDDEGNIFSFIYQRAFWEENLNYKASATVMSTVWDFENVWEFVGSGDPLDAPYCRLR